MWWIPGPWLELPPHILRAMDSTVRQDNSSSLELHCQTFDDCDRKVIKSGFKISKLNSVLSSSALSPTHASTPVWWSYSLSAQLVGVCLMTPSKDFSTSPTVSRSGVQPCKQVLFREVGAVEGGMPSIIWSEFLLLPFRLTVLDSCLYFYTVVTAFSSSFLPRKEVLVSQNILLLSWLTFSPH